jgi:hypothetical protein
LRVEGPKMGTRLWRGAGPTLEPKGGLRRVTTEDFLPKVSPLDALDDRAVAPSYFCAKRAGPLFSFGCEHGCDLDAL